MYCRIGPMLHHETHCCNYSGPSTSSSAPTPTPNLHSQVDVKKAPGLSEIPTPTLWGWLRSALQLRHVWGSPNLVWSVIALAIYFLAPYDLSPGGVSAAAPLSAAFFRARLPLWLAVTFGYTGFFHVTLYGLDWAARPFIKDRPYNVDKVVHNLFWSLCGVVIWVRRGGFVRIILLGLFCIMFWSVILLDVWLAGSNRLGFLGQEAAVNPDSRMVQCPSMFS